MLFLRSIFDRRRPPPFRHPGRCLHRYLVAPPLVVTSAAEGSEEPRSEIVLTEEETKQVRTTLHQPALDSTPSHSRATPPCFTPPPLFSHSPPSPLSVNQVGNLVADDEYMGLSMELTELVRVAVLEDIKKNARDFLGKEEYKVGDIRCVGNA